jgi:hypothetical protein
MYSNRESVEEGGLISYATTRQMHIAAPESTWLAFSTVSRPPTCRSIRPPNSNS